MREEFLQERSAEALETLKNNNHSAPPPTEPQTPGNTPRDLAFAEAAISPEDVTVSAAQVGAQIISLTERRRNTTGNFATPDEPAAAEPEKARKPDEKAKILTAMRLRYSNKLTNHSLISRYRNPEEQSEETSALSGDPVQDIMLTAQGYRLLTPEDEIILFRTISKGTGIFEELGGQEPSTPEQKKAMEAASAAYEVIILCNLRLVYKEAARYIRKLPDLVPELISEGSGIALHKAIAGFDIERGFKFSTYASWWIKQTLDRYIKNHGRSIRVPIHKRDELDKIYAVGQRLRQTLGREPSDEEIADRSEIDVTRVRELKPLRNLSITSLDQHIKGDADRGTLGEIIEDPRGAHIYAESVNQISYRETLKELLAEAGLDERERQVVSLRHGVLLDEFVGVRLGADSMMYEDILRNASREVPTLEELGQVFGVTRERIRQIEMKALKKLAEQAEFFGTNRRRFPSFRSYS